MSWYIISTPRHQEKLVKEMLAHFHLPTGLSEQEEGTLNTYLPLRRVPGTSRNGLVPQESVAPAIPGLLFVQGSLQQLQICLNETLSGCRLYVDVNHAPIRVPDFQIRLFKDYISLVDSEVMVLRKPYSYFLQKKHIRILNGPFKGLEGRLFQIKGNYKLVYGLGNTALAISDIARYTYVEVTDEPASQLRYAFYYEAVSADMNALMSAEAPQNEVMERLRHWRQEASVLSLESPLASAYVSLALQQVMADLYDHEHAFLRDEIGAAEVASLYQDTLDYLDMAQERLGDEDMVQQLELRRQEMSRRELYFSDPLRLVERMDAGNAHYGWVRRQEVALRKAQQLLSSDGHQKEAFTLLVKLFDGVADKFSQSSFQNHLDNVASYRLRRLLEGASHLYRHCREGQDEEFVRLTQSTLRRLLGLPIYQSTGFFDLLMGVKRKV